VANTTMLPASEPMDDMHATLFNGLLVLATFLCSLVAGFLFAFAAVVMPGIRNLDDGGFIRAFQVIDRVIQNAQPLFVLVWAGSAVAVIAVGTLGMWAPSGADRLLVIIATVVYLVCVQLPTATINVPLNNRLQALDVAAMSESLRQRERGDFERRWNRWNVVRTVCASLVSLLLLLVLART
jgi:uncharacterized membrane protein